MPRQLTPTQREALRRLADPAARLVRWPGGFWTAQTHLGYPSRTGYMVDGVTPCVPEWWIATGTVRALERLGLVAAMDTPHSEPWCWPRALTEAGEAALGLLTDERIRLS